MVTELEQRRNAAVAKTAELAALMNQPEAARVPSRVEVFPELIQGSDEWHAQRRGMITASAIGTLITARRPWPSLSNDTAADP